MRYRLWQNDERTILFRVWEDGSAELATRPTSDDVWGPPASLIAESVPGMRTPTIEGDDPRPTEETRVDI